MAVYVLNRISSQVKNSTSYEKNGMIKNQSYLTYKLLGPKLICIFPKKWDARRNLS